MVKKAQQRLFFVRKFKAANVPSQLLVNSYRSKMVSNLCHFITLRYTTALQRTGETWTNSILHRGLW